VWGERARLVGGGTGLDLQKQTSLLLGGSLALGLNGADVVAGHLTHEVIEELLDVNGVLGRGLEVGTVVELLGEVLAVAFGDDTLVLQIALVADQDRGEVLLVLDTDNLVADVLEVGKGRLGNDGVDEDEALAILHVKITHGSKLLRASGIKYLKKVLVAINLDVLTIRVLDCRIILLDEYTLDELHSDGRLADTSRAEDDNFVLEHHVDS